MKIILTILICTNIAVMQLVGQSSADKGGIVYEIPFTSKGNVIELSVANISAIPVEEIRVEATTAPNWLKFQSKEITLTNLNAKEEKSVDFVFFLEKNAEVNKEQTLNFTITDKSGQRWNKEIKIAVEAPATYELHQNYPNPFNPTTTIKFDIPNVGTHHDVSLKIYDIVGREIANVVDQQQEAGYHEVLFNAQNLASGIYFYQLTVKDEQNQTKVFRKKMILLR